MKHLSVKLDASPSHDAKGYFCRIFNDRNGKALTMSDADANYWASRLAELGFNSSEHAVLTPLPGHIIKSRNLNSMRIARVMGDMLILKCAVSPDTYYKEWMRTGDIMRTEVEPTERYVDGRMVPTWNLDEFDLVPCRCGCGVLVPVAASVSDETDAECWQCLQY